MSDATPDERIDAIRQRELEEAARSAMDKLYVAMSERGVVTTMMYDFGVPAVVEALAEMRDKLEREIAFVRERMESFADAGDGAAIALDVILGRRLDPYCCFGERCLELRDRVEGVQARIDKMERETAAERKRADAYERMFFCPCRHDPCSDTCPCANPVMSGVCSRCAALERQG